MYGAVKALITDSEQFDERGSVMGKPRTERPRLAESELRELKLMSPIEAIVGMARKQIGNESD